MADETAAAQPSNSTLMDDFLAAYETLEHEQKNKEKSKFLGLANNVSFSAEDVDIRTKSSTLLSANPNGTGSSGSVKDGLKKKESKHRRSKSDSKKEENDKPKTKSKKKKKSKDVSAEESPDQNSEESEEEDDTWYDPSVPVSDPVLFAVPLKNPKSDYTEHQIILYRGQDDHIHYMYSPDDEEWKHIDLTLKVGTPPAAGEPSGYHRTVGNHITRYIVYKGEDDCLHQISSKDDGKNWTHRNLSKIALQYQPKPIEKQVSKVPSSTELPAATTSTTNNPVPATPEKKNTIVEVFRVAATVGDISSVATVKADMSSTVQDLVQKVMSRFPKDAEQDNYFLLANTKNGPKWLMDTQKHLYEVADILVEVQYQLELRKLSKNSMIRAKTNPENSPLSDKRKQSRTMRLSFAEAKSLQF